MSNIIEQLKASGVLSNLQQYCQIILSVYALRHSYVAITNLRKYEETSKKAAQWSDEAQKQLNKTRTTQGAGALTSTLCLLAAAALLIPGLLTPWTRKIVSPTMLVIVIGARRYIKGFWAPGETDSKGKDQGTRVPLPKMGDYNLAVEKTEDLLKCLEYMEYSWVITSLTGLAPR